MKDLLLTLLHLAVMTAKLCGPGGVRAVIAKNLLLKQQLIALRRARQRAPNLTLSDRLLCGFGSLFLSPGRIRKLAPHFRCGTRRKHLLQALTDDVIGRSPEPRSTDVIRIFNLRRAIDDEDRIVGGFSERSVPVLTLFQRRLDASPFRDVTLDRQESNHLT